MQDQTSFNENVQDSFSNRLKREVFEWKKGGLITDDIEQKILAQYGEQYHERLKIQRQSRLTQLIAMLGAILIGVGVLLFIAANWQTIPTGLKLTIIFSSIGLAYGIGILLDGKGYHKTGNALIFLGSILYGAGIALIAQIYHIQAGNGTLFLLWGIGVFASGIAIRSQLFLSFSSLLFTAWTLFVRFGTVQFIFLFLPFISRFREIVHWEYFIPAGVLISISYWLQMETLLAVSLLGVLAWFGFAISQWGVGVITAIIFYLILGALLLAVAFFHIYVFKFPRKFALPYSFFGAAFILITSYLLSFNTLLNQFHSQTLNEIETTYWIFLIAVSLTAVLGSIIIAFTPRFIAFIRFGFLGLAALVVFSLIFLFFPISEGFYANAFKQGLFSNNFYPVTFNLYTLVWNILLAIEIIGIIVLGYVTHERRYVNIGIVFFVLQVMSRYFDVFALYFGTYVSFIIGGFLFILLSFSLERFRRKLLQRMQGTPVSQTSDMSMGNNV